MTAYLSRARLRPTASVATLRDLLLPADESARVTAAHKLVWALFTDGPDRQRDFLWRETALGEFFFLSARPPQDPHDLFEIDPPKVFAPVLSAGDRLVFSLRANATVSRGTGEKGRGKVEDVVMHALYGLDQKSRQASRSQVVTDVGRAWLVRQGARCGFDIGEADVCRVDSHRVVSISRRGPGARLGVLDLSGTLTVTDPVVFLGAVASGFGRAKAFGNGLMLIRRA
jgi:CRISPR system Cascade subunit CasE